MKNGYSIHTLIKKNRQDEKTVELVKTTKIIKTLIIVNIKEV
jgi:hypothetical protein